MSVLCHLLVGVAAPAAGRISLPVEGRNHPVRHLGLDDDAARAAVGHRPADPESVD